MEDEILIEIQRLSQIIHKRGLRELSISRPDFSVSMVAVQAAPSNVINVPQVGAEAAPLNPVVPAPEEVVSNRFIIASPLIGIFYRSSSPDSPQFVEVGDYVEVGQTIGIVEAMKVFNEITSDHAGIVTAIPGENGTLVQVDQPLVIIEPSI